MPDNADSPGRAGQSGSGGGQPAPGDSPVPVETKKVAKPFGASVSDADPVADLSGRAQERFRELTQRLKGAEEELARLRNPQANAPAPFSTAPIQQPQGNDYDRLLNDLEKSLRKVREAGDVDAELGLVRQIAKIEGQRSSEELLRGFFVDQQQREATTRFVSEAERAWDLATRRFPELQDEGTELYQQAKQIWENDPDLRRSSNGMYRAAQAAWSDRAMKATRPNSLESSHSFPARVSATGDIQGDKTKTLEAMKSGDKGALEKFLNAHLDTIMVRPGQ